MSYGRSFIILSREEALYCDASATGYCKIEIKSDKSRIKVFVQGLKFINEPYEVYLIIFDEELIYANIGQLRMNKESGELIVDVNSNNVLNTGKSINKFNIITLCKKDGTNYSFPLSGYNNIKKDDKWKLALIDKFQQTSSYNRPDSRIIHEEVSLAPMSNIEEVNLIQNEEIKVVEDEVCDKYRILKKGNLDDVSKVMNSLNGVIEYNPFKSSKLKYKWWKIQDVMAIEDILERSIASQQIFRHPLLKKMHKDSEYFLFGVVSDLKDKIKYLSFGFFTKYSTKDQFYVGGFSNFYPQEGCERKNGDSGYWIVHIRVDNDNIVITV